ncbi:5'-nucleotidase C-terminal domain-containing protein, partial [Casaltella massiliensis]|nr:5'-nucleotidase C-terminal domain-containing protein [Casaltella massiliensis]
KYDSNGNTINQDSQRISNLKHNGKNLDPNQEFLVVTNNYRASGTFPGIKDAQVVYSSPDENRQAVMDYIKETGKITPSKDNNWKIKPVKTNAK